MRKKSPSQTASQSSPRVSASGRAGRGTSAFRAQPSARPRPSAAKAMLGARLTARRFNIGSWKGEKG